MFHWNMGDINKADVATRLEILRAAAGLTQEEIAADAGYSSKSGWNNVISPDQKTIIDVQEAGRLCDHHSVTLDWIYRNSVAGMSDGIKEKIASVRRRLAAGEDLGRIRRSNRVERLRDKPTHKLGKGRR